MAPWFGSLPASSLLKWGFKHGTLHGIQQYVYIYMYILCKDSRLRGHTRGPWL